MTDEEAKLSKHARNLWKRVQDPSNYYAYKGKPGRYMRELIDAGLVQRMGRIKVVGLYFVPVGSTPLKSELFPGVLL